jgi:hypothetical protein
MRATKWRIVFSASLLTASFLWVYGLAAYGAATSRRTLSANEMAHVIGGCTATHRHDSLACNSSQCDGKSETDCNDFTGSCDWCTDTTDTATFCKTDGTLTHKDCVDETVTSGCGTFKENGNCTWTNNGCACENASGTSGCDKDNRTDDGTSCSGEE